MALRLLFIFSLLTGAVSLGFVAWQFAMPQRPRSVVVGTIMPPAEPPAPQRYRVLAAARQLSAGLMLRDEDFMLRDYAPSEVPEGALVQSEETRLELRGALLRRFVERGQPLRREDVLRPRDRGFLAAVLQPGMRAVSIAVDMVTGNAGLIWPGDLVDVILTQQTDEADTPAGRRVWGETVMSEVRIIAVDQEITQGATAPAAAGRTARTVTLEVTPGQAERVVVAVRLGRVSLALRAIDLAGDAYFPGRTVTVFGSDVSPALGMRPEEGGTVMRIIQGADQQEVRFR